MPQCVVATATSRAVTRSGRTRDAAYVCISDCGSGNRLAITRVLSTDSAVAAGALQQLQRNLI
jgi:hypothetical protein